MNPLLAVDVATNVAPHIAGHNLVAGLIIVIGGIILLLLVITSFHRRNKK